jgi:hypothetical protein
LKFSEAKKGTLLRALIRSFVYSQSFETVLLNTREQAPAVWEDLAEKLVLAVQLQEGEKVGPIETLLAQPRPSRPSCFGQFNIHVHRCRACLWGVECRQREVDSLASWAANRKAESGS